MARVAFQFETLRPCIMCAGGWGLHSMWGTCEIKTIRAKESLGEKKASNGIN